MSNKSLFLALAQEWRRLESQLIDDLKVMAMIVSQAECRMLIQTLEYESFVVEGVKNGTLHLTLN